MGVLARFRLKKLRLKNRLNLLKFTLRYDFSTTIKQQNV